MSELENHLVVDAQDEYEQTDLLSRRRRRLNFKLNHGIPEPVIEEDGAEWVESIFHADQAG